MLDLLADRKVIGEWSGEILFNGGLRSRWFQRDSAYILQDDLHIPTLTVRESIEFSAKVRLIEGTTAAEINERVDLLLDLMGLEHVQDSLVGGQKIRGISGGQLKRLSIAVEIVSLPDFIALDEPTSGLDSFMALEVMNTVKKLCLQNRTCVSTIHQPSAQVFALFDTIILIADGRLIYAGGTKDVLSYFQSLGFHYEIGENPAEFVIEISQSAVSSQRYGYQSPQQLEKHFQAYRTSKKLYQPYQRRPSEETVTEFQLNRLHATTKSTQFVHLLRRELLAITRNRNEILALVVKNMVVACLIGIIFFNQVHVNLPLYDAYGVPKAEVNNISALLFFGLMHTMVSNVESIPHLCARHAIFQREVNAFAYSVSPYWLAHSLSVLPVQLIGFLSFIFICYFLCSFPISWEYFFYFSGILWIASLSSYYLAMAIAAWTADEKIAFIVFPLTFLFFSTFSGYAIAVDEVPKMWSWAPWISYVRWAFEGLMTNQWEDYSSVEDNDGYSTVLSLYDFEGFDKGNSFWIMALVVGFNMLLAYVAMRPKPRQLVKLSMQGMTEHEGSTHSMVMESVVASNPLQASIESSESLREKLLPTSPQRSSQSQSIAASLSQRLSQPSASSASSASTTTTSILKGLEEGATSAPFLAETPSAYHFADIENSPGLELLFRDLHYFIPNPHYSPNRDLRPGSHVSSPSTSGKHNSNSSSGGVSGAATSSSAPLGEGGKDLHVLKGISGIIKAGQMTALMGSSGAGKSTLLDILAMRKTMGDIRGAVLINNKVQSMELMQSSSAYVMQENVFLSCLTVEETLYFAAQLRLPERWSKEEKDKRVQQILSVLALHPVADSFVGDEVRRGISGGQKKRLAIGIEIIHLPDILFLGKCACNTWVY